MLSVIQLVFIICSISTILCVLKIHALPVDQIFIVGAAYSVAVYLLFRMAEPADILTAFFAHPGQLSLRFIVG